MLNQESKFKYYPDIIFSNSSVDIKNESASIFIRESNIKIMKSYWPLSPLNINLKAPVMKVNGREINNIFIKAKYNNNILNITEFKGNIAEGNFQISGNTQLSELIPFALNGKFNNISLNTFLQQSEIAVWDRLTVKLSSDNFKINGYKYFIY